MSESPLAEAKKESIEELMRRDPLEHSRKNRDEIVRILREQRAAFAKLEAEPKVKKARPADPNLSLDDLLS